MRTPAPGKSRRAFTLIELAVVVSITSVLFALSATTLVALMRVERQCSAEVALDRAVARLAGRFRADAHAAVAADCTSGCALDLGGGKTVRYSFSSPAVIRELCRGETIEHRDSFLLNKDASVLFALNADSRLVTMHLSRLGSRPPLPAVPLEIAAAVNLHGTAQLRPQNTPPAAEATP